MKRYWEWDAPFTIRPEETALLIIDMQTGFTQPDGPLFTPQSGEQLAATSSAAFSEKTASSNSSPAPPSARSIRRSRRLRGTPCF